MKDKLTELVESYKAQQDNLSERDRAILEEDIWQAAIGTVKGSRPQYLLDTLGADMNDTRARLVLLRNGDTVNRLWHLVHYEKMPLATASRLCRKAKEVCDGSDAVKMTAAIDSVLEEYNKLTDVVIRPDGKVFRRSPGYKKGRPPRKKKKFENKIKKDLNDDDLLAKVRGLVVEYVSSMLEDTEVDSVIRENLCLEFRQDVNVLIESFRAKLRRLGSSSRQAELAINRPKLLKAFEILKLRAPLIGESINLEEVKRQKKKLARVYHPDSNGGDPATAGVYQAVLESYDLIEQYAERQQSERKKKKTTQPEKEPEDAEKEQSAAV